MKKQNTFTVMIGFVVVILIGLLLTGCGAKEAETIKIGSIGIYSGEGSAWGIAAKNGIDMAV